MLLISCYRGIMHDPVMFPSPEKFEPNRFLETKDARLQNFELPFGFGRRICPGMHLALNSIFINVARLLWGFNILPALDAEGNEIIPDTENFTDGFNSRPVSFDCRFVARSERVSGCIEREWGIAKEKLAGWE